MTDYRTILKRVGSVWVVFGLIDIAFMIYCLMQRQSYSSGFNIFAVIIGVFLICGSLGAARLATWLSAFMLTMFAGIILIFPFIQPIGLLLTQAKLNPVGFVLRWLMAIAIFILLGWTYKRLRSQPILEARVAIGRTTSKPKTAIGFGIVLVAFLAVMLNFLLNGAAGTKAVELARQKQGMDYHYAVQSIQMRGRHYTGIVIAYNDKEMKYVPVSWNE